MTSLMAITSAIFGHYYAQTSAADSNHCNTPACRHVAGMVPELHCRSLNKWLYTSGAARENHCLDRCYTLHLTGLYVPPGTMGRLAVRGPTGCRYLADERQRRYVQNGWNITGDTYVMDSDGYFWYQSRSDDMIVSAGYNIAGTDVEAALLTHPAVAECGVVGAPDEARGMIVKAYVVTAPGATVDAQLVSELQEHVKREIAPYKYPRAIEFVTQLPKTETGKLKRFALRQMAQAATASPGVVAE